MSGLIFFCKTNVICLQQTLFLFALLLIDYLRIHGFSSVIILLSNSPCTALDLGREADRGSSDGQFQKPGKKVKKRNCVSVKEV